MASKDKCIKFHARRRFEQRTGIVLTKILHDELVAKIQSNKATFIDRQSHRITIWEVEVEGKKVRLFYDKNRKLIVTCISKER